MIDIEGLRGSKYKTQQRPIGLVQLSGRSSFPVSMSPPWKGAHGPRKEPMDPERSPWPQASLHDTELWGSGQCFACPTSTSVSGNSEKTRLEFHKTHVLPPAPLLIFTNNLISQEGFEEPLRAVPKGSPWVRTVRDWTTQPLPQITPKRAQLLN